jgi:para-nitrobenzyl esterase
MTSRRDILVRGPVALAGAAWIERNAFADGDEKPQYIEVKTAYGTVRGAASNGLVTFKGVPYAGSVSGPNRFKKAAMRRSAAPPHAVGFFTAASPASM